MTVEASLVMPIVLLTFFLLIRTDFRLHDIVFGNLAANEITELSGHRLDNDTTDLEYYGTERMKNMLSGAGSIKTERHGHGSVTIVDTAGKRRKLTDEGLRPEELMRAVTLAEGLPE